MYLLTQTHKSGAMFRENIWRKVLGEEIGWLIMCADVFRLEHVVNDLLSNPMIANIDVLAALRNSLLLAIAMADSLFE